MLNLNDWMSQWRLIESKIKSMNFRHAGDKSCIYLRNWGRSEIAFACRGTSNQIKTLTLIQNRISGLDWETIFLQRHNMIYPHRTLWMRSLYKFILCLNNISFIYRFPWEHNFPWNFDFAISCTELNKNLNLKTRLSILVRIKRLTKHLYDSLFVV